MSDSTTERADRPVPGNIEITEEMVEAGTEVFTSYDSRFEGPEAVVYEIFATMMRVSREEPAEADRSDRVGRTVK